MFRIDPDTAAYWEGTTRGELMVTRCGECRYWVHPARAICPQCHSSSMHPERASGEGTVYTFTATSERTVVWVELAEQERLIVIGELLGSGNIAIGEHVQVSWVAKQDRVVPAFERTSA